MLAGFGKEFFLRNFNVFIYQLRNCVPFDNITSKFTILHKMFLIELKIPLAWFIFWLFKGFLHYCLQ